MRGTLMLVSAVYIEVHPRRSAAFASRMHLRDAAPGHSTTPLRSFNSFIVNGFRTPFTQRRSRNPFFFNRLGTLSIATRGVYPPRIFLLSALHSVSSTKSLGITSLQKPRGGGTASPACSALRGEGVFSRKDRATQQQSRKFGARAERRLRGGRRRPPASSSQREAELQGNRERREDGAWREARSPVRRLA